MALSPQQPADRPRASLSILTQMLRFLSPYRRVVAAAAVALVIAASGVLALGHGLRLVVDRGFVAGDPALLNQALLGMLVLISVLSVASALRYFLVSWIGERVAADLRTAVFNRVVGLDQTFYDATRVGEIQSRITTDTAVLQTIFGSSLSIALRNTFLAVGALAMLFVTSPRLTLLVLVGIPLVVVPILWFGRRVRRLSRASQDRIADLSAQVDETLHAIHTVQAFSHEGEEQRRFAGAVGQAFATAIQRVRQRAWLTGMALLMVFSAIGIILWMGGHDVLAGRMTPGQLSAFVFYAVLLAGAVGAISEVTGELMRAAGASERLLELMAENASIVAPANPVSLPQPARGELQLEGVDFAYPSRAQTRVLEALSLHIQPGERVALVGPSGAGKSTVLQLILRFYDPACGRILFDGVDIRTTHPEELRRRIGLVPQEPVLFAASARDNIRYGSPEASDAAVQAAADAALVTEFIDRLPQGMDTPLGERGVRLSGGQRQRIAIARAILRDPALLLLDEATSALDAESEHQVQQALDHLMQGRTSLVIAHRLATVRAADRIVVMDGGRIHAIGTHQALLTESPLYARLAALQFGETGVIPQASVSA
ncbi:MAG: ATP-binding cassette domain-containing protein [Halomonadaceae bacterium]|nr:MAG: ATP-binding cassette domain-containing protein [Halomonadaceae bacterium]